MNCRNFAFFFFFVLFFRINKIGNVCNNFIKNRDVPKIKKVEL